MSSHAVQEVQEVIILFVSSTIIVNVSIVHRRLVNGLGDIFSLYIPRTDVNNNVNVTLYETVSTYLLPFHD